MTIINSYFWDVGYHGIMLRQVDTTNARRCRIFVLYCDHQSLYPERIATLLNHQDHAEEEDNDNAQADILVDNNVFSG